MFPHRRFLSSLLLALFALFFAVAATRAAVPRDFAVDLKATVADSAPFITLSWTQRLQSNITAQKIYRRLKGDTTWVLQATLTTTQTSYVDNTAVSGVEYEYWMERTFSGLTPSTAMGYLSAGVKVPLVENRGKLLLVIDDTMVTPLAADIAQLQQDLTGDGWTVQTITAPRSANAASTKALILSAYNADPTNVKSVYLLGHVPVPYSGLLNPDGHPDHYGAWPADGYYGDVEVAFPWTDTSVNNTGASRTQNQNTPNDGKFDQSSFPSDIELQVGRVDMSGMTRAPSTAVSETTLLRRYLRKAHDFRTKQGAYSNIARAAVIRDGFGHAFSSEPFAVSSWQMAFAGVGADATIPLLEPASGQWWAYNARGTYLIGEGCGGGSYESASSVGETFDFGRNPSGAVFMSLFGSYHGDWDAGNCFLRAPLAGNATGDSLGLVCFWAGRPHWFLHHTGMGETIGYSNRISCNNKYGSTDYVPDGSSTNGVHMALMGDPALRLHIVEPPRNLVAQSASGQVTLRWSASSESGLLGYHVYRGTSASGPFTRLTTSAQAGTTFTDSTVTAAQTYTYLVRTLKLESVPGGSYQNLSGASFATITASAGVGAPFNPSGLAVKQTSGTNAVLTWNDNSTDETNFRVERKTDNGAFTSLGTVPANTKTFTDVGPFAHGSVYYYRVIALGPGGESIASPETSFEAFAGFFDLALPYDKVGKKRGFASILVHRFGGLTGAVSVNYATSNSSAIAGTHYTATSGALTWADGDTQSKYIDVPISTSASFQQPRQFKLTLSSPTNGAALAVTTTTAVLIEDALASVPAPWSEMVLGSVTSSSPTVFAEGGFGGATIGGSGVTSTATSENGTFTWQSRTGDGMLTAFVPTPSPAQSGARFSVMIRGALTSTAAMAAATTSGDSVNFGSKLVYRTVDSGSAGVLPSTNNNHSTPRWIRITRAGSNFTAESSADGATWTNLGSAAVTLPATAFWGLFHYSADYSGTTNSGEFQLGTFQNVTFANLPAPTAPTGFAVSAALSNNVTLTWNGSSTIAGYRIERRDESGSFTQIADVSPSGTTQTFDDTTVAADTAYEYRITSYNSVGVSAPSTPIRTATPAPDISSSITASTGGGGDAFIRYDSQGTNFGAQSVVTIAGTDPATSSLNSVAKAYLRFDLGATPTLKTATLKLAFVAARNLTGTYFYGDLNLLSETSDTWTEGTMTWLNAPQNDTAERGLTGSVNYLTSYFLSGSVTPPAVGSIISLPLPVATVNTNRGANNLLTIAFTPYTFSNVGAVDFASRENGTYAPPTLDLTHAPFTPVRPSFLTATRGAGSNIVLQWTDNSSNETSFAIERREVGGTFAALQTTAANAVTFTDTTSLAGVSYEYRVRAVNAAGNSSFAPIAAVTAGGTTGFSNWLQKNGAQTALVAEAGALPNLMKYALGLSADATGADSRISLGTTRTRLGLSYLTLTYTRPEPAPEGVAYIVESSADLVAWSAEGLREVSSFADAGTLTITVRDAVPSSGTKLRFMRLRVAVP